ncbi:MAG: hypothetical protein HYY97_16380 [Rhodocyclales bacterium]|nr:hypothetical protein [Rhodocyclales bacterium]
MQYFGRTSDEEIGKAVRIAQADERFDRLLYDLHDLRRCESFTFSPSNMSEMAAIDAVAAEALPHKKMAVAVVAGNPDVLASVNAYITSGFNVHDFGIFSSIDDTRAWLMDRTQPFIKSLPRWQ